VDKDQGADKAPLYPTQRYTQKSYQNSLNKTNITNV